MTEGVHERMHDCLTIELMTEYESITVPINNSYSGADGKNFNIKYKKWRPSAVMVDRRFFPLPYFICVLCLLVKCSIKIIVF